MTPTTDTTPGPAGRRRGDALRRRVVLAAKEEFLASGYERTSMDAVAARAETSKRSLYTHFGGKDALLDAVFELVRDLYLDHLGTPEVYAEEPVEAVVRFCARYVQLMTWDAQVRTCRLAIAEADRVPPVARAYFDGVVVTSGTRLAAYLAERWALGPDEALDRARRLLSEVGLPAVVRALLAVDRPIVGEHAPTVRTLERDTDLEGIRRLISASGLGPARP